MLKKRLRVTPPPASSLMPPPRVYINGVQVRADAQAEQRDVGPCSADGDLASGAARAGREENGRGTHATASTVIAHNVKCGVPWPARPAPAACLAAPREVKEGYAASPIGTVSDILDFAELFIAHHGQTRDQYHLSA